MKCAPPLLPCSRRQRQPLSRGSPASGLPIFMHWQDCASMRWAARKSMVVADVPAASRNGFFPTVATGRPGAWVRSSGWNDNLSVSVTIRNPGHQQLIRGILIVLYIGAVHRVAVVAHEFIPRSASINPPLAHPWSVRRWKSGLRRFLRRGALTKDVQAVD